MGNEVVVVLAIWQVALAVRQQMEEASVLQQGARRSVERRAPAATRNWVARPGIVRHLLEHRRVRKAQVALAEVAARAEPREQQAEYQ
jgi:hypothetical protein